MVKKLVEVPSREEFIEVPVKAVQENHLFIMPEDLAMSLAALTAIQDFYTWVAKRGVSATITLFYPDERLQRLSDCLYIKENVKSIFHTDSIENWHLGDYDLVVQFDPDRAFNLVHLTEKHVTQAFGMMIGAVPEKATPDLSKLDIPEPYKDIAILPFPACTLLYEFLGNNHPELNVDLLTNIFDLTPELGVEPYRMVVGIRSGLTYYAAATDRAVVEIYPTDKYRNWESKWSCPLYQMINADPEQVSAELAYRATEALWKRMLSRQQMRRSLTQTEQSTSNASTVETS